MKFTNDINNQGFLFNNLPRLFLDPANYRAKTGNSDNSDSAIFLNITRWITGDYTLSSDNQLLRKFRSGNLEPEQWIDYIKSHSSSFELPAINEDPNGGFLLLQSFIQGIMKETSDKSVMTYLNYVLEFCALEKEMILSCKDLSHDQNINSINTFLSEWLDIPQTKNDTEDLNKYLIALLLHWAALFEHYLFLIFSSMENESAIMKYLPRYAEKDEIELSSFRFLRNAQHNWTKYKYGTKSKDISDEIFANDIAEAKNRCLDIDKDVSNTLLRHRTIIKKNKFDAFEIKHANKVNIEFVQNLIRILYCPHDEVKKAQKWLGEVDESLAAVIFVRIFTSIQVELFEAGVSPQFLVAEFEKYPKYLAMVAKRFTHYKHTNKLHP